jgi:DNA polymerase-3 subunit delta'
LTDAEGVFWVDHALDQLLAVRERLGHALLIHGPSGNGKSLLARRFAAALLCERPQANGRACGRCAACGWFAQDNHPDFRLLAPIDEEAAERGGKAVKPSKDIRIDQVRALAEFAALGGHRSRRRVVLIDPADRLNTPSANALLKTLEEPSEGLQFLLVSSQAQALPPTIRSRCGAFLLPLAPPDGLADWLARSANVPLARARELLAFAGGAPLRAAAFADAAHSAVHRTLMEQVGALPETGTLVAADRLSGVTAGQVVGFLQGWIGDLGRAASGMAPVRFPSVASRLEELARRTSLPQIVAFSAWLDRQSAAAEHPLNARLYCESVLFQYASLFA